MEISDYNITLMYNESVNDDPGGETDDRELLERLELFVGMEVNDTLMSGVFVTNVKTMIHDIITDNSSSSSSPYSGSSLLVIILVPVVLVTLLTIAVTMFCIYWRRHRRKESSKGLSEK